MAELASAQARLAAVQEKIATLEAQYEEATTKKATLAAQVSTVQAYQHNPESVQQRRPLVVVVQHFESKCRTGPEGRDGTCDVPVCSRRLLTARSSCSVPTS
jgi:hypothetical protein